jgi:acyl-CoA synthetase (AMP-forming)/AMP-acid ligase II
LLYEASRFAGVQVVLHALLGGGKLLAIDLQKSFADQVAELAAGGCTHLSATAAMWRKLLMLPAAAGLSLQQITLGGDVADARTLQALAATFPEARIRHIYASTELGIGFSVNDGMPGFPADWLEQREAFPWLKICDGVLWARPSGPRGGGLRCDGEGYICTGDRVEVIGNRILFAGRVDSTTNVGGIKISMEAVEHAVRQHADVLDCRVTARPSPVMGSVLALEVMPRKVNADSVALQRELRSWCRDRLRREARPATISIIIDLPRNGAGKVERRL